MKLLAWDTSSKTGALVALEWDQNAMRSTPRSIKSGGLRIVSEWTLNVEATHSERLLWAIEELLLASHWRLEDVDLFGVGVGPGSFTGLRIGITTARTLAHTLKKPLVGVSSLAALARPAALLLAQEKRRAVVIATTDACKGELFALWGSSRSVVDCVFMADGDLQGLWKRGVEESVIQPEALIKAIKRKLSDGDKTNSAKQGWLAIGEGRSRYLEVWKRLPQRLEMESPAPFFDQIQGRYVGVLAWEAYQAGLAKDALLIHPRYVRASDAELKLRAGILPVGPTRGT
jgi:tRNA threonylcarbamoyladenosine biosynthesis protein TsaB